MMVHTFISEDIPGKFLIIGQILVPEPYLLSNQTKKIIFLLDNHIFPSYQNKGSLRQFSLGSFMPL